MKESTEKNISSIVHTIKFLKKTAIGCCYLGGAYAFFFIMAPKILSNESQETKIEQLSAPQEVMVSQLAADYHNNRPREEKRLADINSSAGLDEYMSKDSWRETAKSPVIKSLLDKSSEPDIIEEKIDQLFPKMKGKVDIRPLGSPDSGLYEVKIAGQAGKVFLMSQDGNYIFNHSYVDISELRSGKDINKIKDVELLNYYPKPNDSRSEENQAPEPVSETSQTSPVDETDKTKSPVTGDFAHFKSVGLKYETTSADPKGDIVVFADFTCDYCKRFHPKYEQVLASGWNIYTVPLSRRGNSGSVYEMANKLYCAPNGKEVYNNLITEQPFPPLEDVDSQCVAEDHASKARRVLLNMGNGSGYTPAIWVNGEEGHLLKYPKFLQSYL